MKETDQIAENIRIIRGNIAAALSGADRAVLLVAATKMNDAGRVRAAIAAGAQSAISHQLKVLKDANLVANRRAGKTVYYFLADDHVRSIILQGFEHLLERRDSTGGEVQP